MTTPIQVIYDYLEENGLFDAWEDSEGEAQSAVEVQTRDLNENCIDKDKMFILIKQNGGSSDIYTGEPVFTFAVFTKVDQPSVYAEDYANLVYAALLNMDTYVNEVGQGGYDSCVISVDPVTPVNGAFKSESGRNVYDTEWVLRVDSGRFF